jgi:hypothetical protein
MPSAAVLKKFLAFHFQRFRRNTSRQDRLCLAFKSSRSVDDNTRERTPAKFYDLELRAPSKAAASILRLFLFFDFLTFGVASASLEISFVIFEIGWAWNWVDIRSGVIWVRERAYGLLIFFSRFLCFAHNDRSPFRLDPMDHIVLISEEKKRVVVLFRLATQKFVFRRIFFFLFRPFLCFPFTLYHGLR